MAENTFPINIRTTAREFYRETSGRNYGIPDALKECLNTAYRPLFMPEIAEARIAADKGDRIWQVWFDSPSVRVAGRGASTNASHKGGTEFVVYAHVPTHFYKPKNIMEAINKGLVNGAGIMPQKEFQRLLDMADDEEVFAIGHDALMNSQRGIIPVGQALTHPQTKPFLGGKERAERYLERHKKVKGDRISIWYSDDLSTKPNEPHGRLLFVGSGYDGLGGGGLGSGGRFVGVREK